MQRIIKDIIIMGFFNFLKREKEFNDREYNDRINNSSIDNQAISSLFKAYIKLNDILGLKSTGICGILVKNMDIPNFNDMRQLIDNILANVSDKQKIGWDLEYRSVIDDYNYLWFILKGKTVEEIVVALNEIGDTVHERGFSRQLLAAVFGLTSGYSVDQNKFLDNATNTNNNNTNQYLIYNYKTDKFYPFIPISLPKGMGNGLRKRRNYEQELKVMAQIKDEIPCEKNTRLWYPIWNIPY
jgi:hypothetical protein